MKIKSKSLNQCNMKKLFITFLLIGWAIAGCNKKEKDEPDHPKTAEVLSVRGYSENTSQEEVKMNDNVVFVKNDLDSKIVSLDDDGTLRVQDHAILDELNISTGDILYSLPTERFPNGYALKITGISAGTQSAMSTKSTKATAQADICYQTEPAKIDEVFTDYTCKTSYKLDQNPDNAIIYNIDDQMENPLPSDVLGNLGASFNMKPILDVWNGKAKDTNPSNSRLKKISITEKKATIEYILADFDHDYKTDKDQIILELTAEYDLSNSYVHAGAADLESGSFSIGGIHNWNIEGTVKYAPKKDWTSDDRKAFEKEFKDRIVGKKFVIARLDLTPFTPTNLLVRPSIDLFYKLTLDVNGEIKVTGGVKNYMYGYDFFASAALWDLQKNFRTVNKGEFYGSIEANIQGIVGLNFGFGLTFGLPAFDILQNPYQKSYVGVYADYGVTVNVKASAVAGKPCINLSATYEAQPSIYAEYNINVKKYNYNGILSVPLNLAKIEKQPLFNEIPFCTDADVIPSDGLVAYYPFNGNANDESGNGNHGELLGKTKLTTDRKGHANSAYNFGGYYNSSAIKIANSTSLHFTDQLTISAWYKLDGLDGMNGYGSYSADGAHCIIAKDGDRGGLWLCRHSAGINNSTSLGSGFSANIPELPSAGEWTHIAAIVGSNSIEIFQNGQSVIKNAYDNVTITEANNRDLYIGMFGIAGGWYPMNGDIDDMRIYNRALTGSDIQALYNE
jgi:hypothetical protein